jgi:cyclase
MRSWPSRPPKDNSGLVIGQHGALVIDAGINPAMAHQIQQTVRRLTDRPILWLANTVYHGDHTFGNAAFPPPPRSSPAARPPRA